MAEPKKLRKPPRAKKPDPVAGLFDRLERQAADALAALERVESKVDKLLSMHGPAPGAEPEAGDPLPPLPPPAGVSEGDEAS